MPLWVLLGALISFPSYYLLDINHFPTLTMHFLCILVTDYSQFFIPLVNFLCMRRDYEYFVEVLNIAIELICFSSSSKLMSFSHFNSSSLFLAKEVHPLQDKLKRNINSQCHQLLSLIFLHASLCLHNVMFQSHSCWSRVFVFILFSYTITSISLFFTKPKVNQNKTIGLIKSQ